MTGKVLHVADDVRPLGAALAAARRERGLSVEEVSAATRIRPAIIRAIEADDFEVCGGAVYARGHLRSVAQVVGADSRPLVEEFDRRFHQPVPALRTAPLGSFEPPRDAGRSGRRSPTWASVAAGVLVVVVIFLGVSWFVGRGGDDAAGAPQAITTSAAAAPTTTPAPKPSATAKPAPKGVVLRLRASGGSSWVSVTNSHGNQLFQGILADGTAKEFRDATKLSVRFGNSPAVRVTQNGKDVGAPRCDRQVCTVAFGSPTAG
jgi:cytoskeletal protein RodZ